MDENYKQNLGDILSLIIQDVSIMQKIHTDNVSQMVGRKTLFFKFTRKEAINITTIEPNLPDEKYSKIPFPRQIFGLARSWLVNKFHFKCGDIHLNIILPQVL